MIVDPDFVDHWKTRLLVGALEGDEAAPVYILRIWSHCQNRRQWVFDNLSSEALKALCRFPGNANKLESSLVASGFVRRDETSLVVCNWEEHNRSLIAAWGNGGKGGRPPARTKGKEPKPTNQEPNDIPGVPFEEPRGSRLDRIGLDKIKQESLKKDSCPEVPKSEPSEPSVMEFPTVGKIQVWGLTQSKVDEYAATYPSLDVLQECRKARQWSIDNPANRKTHSGMTKFLNGWMARAQNSGRANGQRTAGNGQSAEQGRFYETLSVLEEFAAGDADRVREVDRPPLRLEANR